MTNEQQAAYVIAQSACVMARVAGMQAENAECARKGVELTYKETAFDDVIIEYGIHHNAVIGMFAH